MKFKYLLATLTSALALTTGLYAQSLKPGTITFKNIRGSAVSHNINTGATEDITPESLLTEGFVIETRGDGYLDLVFSNGVVARLAPNSRVSIDSFAVGGSARTNRSARMDLSAARSRTSSNTSNLQMSIECGDITVNATEKQEGDLRVKTPTTEVQADLTKFFVSHGKSNAASGNVSRAINLGTMPIQVNTLSENELVSNDGQVTYGHFDPYAETQSTSLGSEATAIILADDQASASGLSPTNAASQACDASTYSLLPFDPCLIDRLGYIADHALYGGSDPLGSLLVTAAADVSYFNINSGEIGDISIGMLLPEGTIIRSSNNGSLSGVFANGATLEVAPASNVYLESLTSQPVLGNPSADTLTHILVRVETGRITASTAGTPAIDTFQVISPLDRHTIAGDTVASVEFLQMDTNAFQTVSQNRTAQGANGVNTVVVSSSNLSLVSDNVTFIEYSQDGIDFSFTTPPSYTHITESAIIPPSYEFIDRTIAFAAGALPGPTAIGTPGNPGNVQRFTEEEDPVSP